MFFESGSAAHKREQFQQTVCVDVYFAGSANKISEAVKKMVRDTAVVILCIGTEKVAGDALGPMVGTIMSKRNIPNVYVYGMLENNVTAKNLHYAARFIEVVHPERTLIVVDAALGTLEQVNTVQICNGGLHPGSATNKNLPKVGNVSILGVVNQQTCNEMAVLTSTKMNNVRFLATTIANGLTAALS